MFRQFGRENEVFLPILTSIAMIPKKCIKREELLFRHTTHCLEWVISICLCPPSHTSPLAMIEYLVHQSDQIEELALLDLQPLMTWVSEDYQVSGKLSIAVLSDAEIREINNRYLQHDYETDCISFDLSDQEDLFDGEVLISADTARRVAKEVGWDAKYEACLYIIHGILHILGYDDNTPDAKKEMREQERYYLQKLGVPGWEKHPSHGEAEYG